MSALIEENPQYQVITVFRIEYSDYRNDPIATDHGITSRATLVMLKGGRELGRVQWQTDRSAIKPLFDAAIDA